MVSLHHGWTTNSSTGPSWAKGKAVAWGQGRGRGRGRWGVPSTGRSTGVRGSPGHAENQQPGTNSSQTWCWEGPPGLRARENDPPGQTLKSWGENGRLEPLSGSKSKCSLKTPRPSQVTAWWPAVPATGAPQLNRWALGGPWCACAAAPWGHREPGFGAWLALGP